MSPRSEIPFPSTATITSPSTNLPPAVQLALPAAGLTALAFEANEFFAMIQTLASDNRVNVLSSPHVLTTENKKAVINVSRSVPILTSQQVPIGATPSSGTNSIVGTQTVEYKDAGIILTVGVGVDTNVLVFERIREELRNGKTVRVAIQNGFERVWITILDTHATALIAAAFLFQFGTGAIKGFAVTLVIGLVSNVFASYFVSKFIFEWLLGKRHVESLSI